MPKQPFMKKINILILLLIPIIGFSQNDYLTEYQKAESLLQTNEIDTAFVKFKELEKSLPKNDSLYENALWYKVATATHLEEIYRFQEKFEQSLTFAREALDGIEKGIEIFDEDFAKRKFFMVKNIMVANYGLGNFEEGKKWKEKMYEAKGKNQLPEGIDENFNFDFFKFEDKNIWGYEWYAELPKDRFSGSFTKVVYYVYSTNPDGSDKDQLYRLHVLMFHNIEPSNGIDYVLTKRLETAKNEVSGTLYAYTYKEDIDYEKLKNDVKEVLKGNLKPDTKSTTTKDKDGKVKVDIEIKNKKH
jgi:tetratricopeptide (TPR) repeat protein